jgi:ribosomal protein S18 acetylase RimI-like enzyme
VDIIIRDAEPADVDAIVAGNANMALETEERVLDPVTLRRGVQAVFEDAARAKYWVAEVDGRVIGQLMLTWEWSDWRNGTMWWIQSVHVHPEYRRRGVFRTLYRHIERLARGDRDCCGIRLYVERDNLRAQETYKSLGMTIAGYSVMETDFGDLNRD